MSMKEATMADSKTLSRERYARFADGYVASETHAKGSDLDRLVAIAQPQSHWHSLDIATGGGHTALKFAPLVNHVVASDLTPRMLQRARKFIVEERGVGNVSFKEADAEDLPFNNNYFDLVTCRIAPHHFPDALRFLRECQRVLKPGAILALQDQVLPVDAKAASLVDAFEKIRDPSHNRAYSAAEWKQLFEAAEMKIEHSEIYIKRHNFLDWARRQACDESTINQLVSMLADAPTEAREWMDPRDWGGASASFVNRHILMHGRAP